MGHYDTPTDSEYIRTLEDRLALLRKQLIRYRSVLERIVVVEGWVYGKELHEEARALLAE